MSNSEMAQVTRVGNLRTLKWSDVIGQEQVLIDRRTKWGNPFKIGSDGTREEVIAKYRIWIRTQTDLLTDLPSLRGKMLLCWCKPLTCHGDVLAELAENDLNV